MKGKRSLASREWKETQLRVAPPPPPITTWPSVNHVTEDATEDGLKIQFENYGKKSFSLLTRYSNLHSAIYLDYMSTICTCDDVETIAKVVFLWS